MLFRYLGILLLFFTQTMLSALESAVDTLDLQARSAVLMDAATGVILYEKDADQPIPPASLTKLMTIHIAQNEAERLGISLDEQARLPKESWHVNQPPRSSLMFLAQGQIVSLRELFLGLAIPSGNDAAVAVALNFAPDIDTFCNMMNDEAARLGLSLTHFVEPSGISEENFTTAREFAIFCREYIKAHPQNLADYHSVLEFAYPKPENLIASMRKRPGTIVQSNHINLITRFQGVDGLKTGYIDEAGYNIALTAERDGTRFIAVILGVPAELGVRRGVRARDADGVKLLDWGFDNFKTLRLALPAINAAKVWKGRARSVALLTTSNGAFTIPADRGESPRLEIEADELIAPFDAGTPAGRIVLYDDRGSLDSAPLVTAFAVEKGNFFIRLWHSIVLLFKPIKVSEPMPYPIRPALINSASSAA